MKRVNFKDEDISWLEKLFGKNYYRMLTDTAEGVKSDSHFADIIKSRIIWLKIRGDSERVSCLIYGFMAAIDGTFPDYCKNLIKRRLKNEQ